MAADTVTKVDRNDNSLLTESLSKYFYGDFLRVV